MRDTSTMPLAWPRRSKSSIRPETSWANWLITPELAPSRAGDVSKFAIGDEGVTHADEPCPPRDWGRND